jgi:hypothetical protein
MVQVRQVSTEYTLQLSCLSRHRGLLHSSSKRLISSAANTVDRAAQAGLLVANRPARRIQISRGHRTLGSRLAASRQPMVHSLVEFVDLKQACLIAAGVFGLWRLANFIR